MAEGAKVGFPVLVKAALGGGGKGMKLAMHQDELEVCLLLLQDFRHAFNTYILYSNYITHTYIYIICSNVLLLTLKR